MIRRLLTAVGLTAAVALGGGLLTAPTANALPFVSDCKTSPTPDAPGTGIAGWFEPTQPDGASSATGAPLYEQYGLAGMQWSVYDLGCGPDSARDPGAVGGTAIANWTMDIPKALLAVTGALDRVAFHPTWLGVFDPLIEQMVAQLRTNVFEKWVGLPIALIGLTILWNARRGHAASATQAAGAGLVVLVAAACIFNAPTQLGHTADGLVQGGVGAVANVSGSTSGDPALTMQDAVYDDIIYPMWLSGELGSATSPTAKKYGHALLAATAYTWQEQKTCTAAGPISIGPISMTACQATAAAKADSFKKIAGEIHDSDPSAYAHLTGHESNTRVGMAMLATLAMLVLLPFLFMCGLLVLGAYAIIRVAIMLSPIVALVAVKQPKVGRLALNSVGAALINAVAFALGAVIMVAVVGVALSPGLALPTWLGLTIAALFGFVGWHVLKPFRKLTTMVTGQNIVGDATGALPNAGRHVARFVKQTAGTLATAYVGGRVAGHTAAEDIAEAEDERTHRVETDNVAAVLVPDETAPRSTTAPQALTATATATTTRIDRPDAPADTTGLPPLPQPPDGPPPVGVGSGQPLAVTVNVTVTPDSSTSMTALPTAPNADLPQPVWPTDDGSYEVYRPGDAPELPVTQQTDDGSYTIWRPDGTT